MDHLVAIEDKAVGLFVSTQPAEAADQMFDGSGGAYQAANGDVTVNKQMYNVSHSVNGALISRHRDVTLVTRRYLSFSDLNSIESTESIEFVEVYF